MAPELQHMNIKYFQDTDTLYIEFKAADVVESKDLDDNTLLDLDQSGNICGMTVEHARQRARTVSSIADNERRNR